MSELPMFDEPLQKTEDAPRKPRQKPAKRQPVAKKRAIVKSTVKRGRKPKAVDTGMDAMYLMTEISDKIAGLEKKARVHLVSWLHKMHVG